MKNLVKFIRARAGNTQNEMAALLGTTSITVNRWENGKSVPNKMAQRQLYEFCLREKIDTFAYLLKAYTSEGALYHGSKSGIVGTIKPCSRSRCDFGRGFYMGTNPLQPLTLICNEEKPVFYSLQLDKNQLSVLELPYGIEWAMLIAYYRGYMDKAKGTAIYEKYAEYAKGYDVVAGLIADDRMYSLLTDFFEMHITDTALLEGMSALSLGKQYVAMTEKACRQISVTDKWELSELELLLLQEMAYNRRLEGNQLAVEARKKHRRDGLFFDELMERGV